MRKTGYLGFYRGYDIIRDRPDAIRILRDKVLVGSTTSMAAAVSLIDLLVEESCKQQKQGGLQGDGQKLAKQAIEGWAQMKNYERLANAIIEEACKDYKRALKAVALNGSHERANRTISECECFFRSEWFTALTDVDPEYIMQRLREDACK